MSKEPKRNVYVGHRYVPKIMGEWDKQETYEGLSIVTYQGTSYTSKKRVPVGVDILNEEYWVVTGNYNAQVETYRQEVREMKDSVDGKADLYYVDEKINYITSQVGQIANTVSSYPLQIPEKDDSARLLRALNDVSIKENKVLMINEDLQLNSDIDIPNGVKVFSLNSSILNMLGEMIINLKGNNIIDGLQVKGNGLSSTGLIVTGDNVIIRNNELEGFHNNNGRTVALTIETNVENTQVYFNKFDKMSSVENGVLGDEVGTVRAIWNKGKRTVITQNEFRGLVGYEDGDYIYVSSISNYSSVYPHNISGYFFSDLSTIITDNKFYDTTKSAVKLHASGNLVLNNELINDGVDLRYAIRGYESFSNIIKGNTIQLLNGSKLTSSLFQFQRNSNILIKDNDFYTDESFEMENVHDFINNVGLIYENNTFNGEQVDCNVLFYLNGAKNCSVLNNHMMLQNVRQQFVFNSEDVYGFNVMDNNFIFNQIAYPIVINTQSEGVTNVKITNNKYLLNTLISSAATWYFRSVTDIEFLKNELLVDSKTVNINISFNDCEGVNVFDNIIDGRITIEGLSNNVIIDGNHFRRDVKTPIILNYELENISITHNTAFKCFAIVSLNGAYNKKNIDVVGNTVKEFREAGRLVFIDSIAQDHQDSKEIYVEGNTKSRGIDYGSINERPEFSLKIGHSYYDTYYNTLINWNGSTWTGETE